MFVILFLLLSFPNKSLQNINYKRNLNLYDNGYYDSNGYYHGNSYDSTTYYGNSCDTKKCVNVWKIIGFSLLGLIMLIFTIVIIYNIYLCVRTPNISSINYNYQHDFHIIAFEETIKKKHYLLQNDLNWKIYNETMINNREECSICLDKFIDKKSRVSLTPCNHIFHFSCLKEYILKSNDIFCPNCKFNFFSLFDNKNIDFNSVRIDNSLPNNNIDDDEITENKIKEEEKKESKDVYLTLNENIKSENINQNTI